MHRNEVTSIVKNNNNNNNNNNDDDEKLSFAQDWKQKSIAVAYLSSPMQLRSMPEKNQIKYRSINSYVVNFTEIDPISRKPRSLDTALQLAKKLLSNAFTGGNLKLHFTETVNISKNKSYQSRKFNGMLYCK